LVTFRLGDVSCTVAGMHTALRVILSFLYPRGDSSFDITRDATARIGHSNHHDTGARHPDMESSGRVGSNTLEDGEDNTLLLPQHSVPPS
jgi:hypothetical protein